MLGEGFDFPNLKVAAIHTPHHSLGVTLQFIGRFARTGKEGIGDAKFLAVREQLRSEVDILFKEAAIWQEIVANLASTKVDEEIRSREIAETFKRVKAATEDVQDIDLTSFRPYCHVKVYRIDKFIGFLTPKFPHGFTVEKEVVSDELQCALILTKEITRPRWTHYESLSRQESDFFVIYYDDKAKLLFINSSRRGSLAVYDTLSQYYSARTASPLPLPIINRVLANIHDSTWFSVGMKNRVFGSNTESYRSLVGRSADKSVSREDGRLFDRGHISGRGMENGKAVSIGYSRSSKIWSNKSVRVSTLIEWCQKAAQKLMEDQVVATGSNLDYLEVGEELASLPSNIIAVNWEPDVYSHDPLAKLPSGDEVALLDFGIEMMSQSGSTLRLRIFEEAFEVQLDFCISAGKVSLSDVSGIAKDFLVWRKDTWVPLIAYLRDKPIDLFLSDFSRISGATIFREKGTLEPFPPEYIESWDWLGSGIDIQKEFYKTTPIPPSGKKLSVQCHLSQRLCAGCIPVIFYDHRSGEIADLIAVEDRGDAIWLSLYHCKASAKPKAGERVGDVYEVAGQVVKSLVWLRGPEEIERRITERARSGSVFHKGTSGDLSRLLALTAKKTLRICIWLVQPGISAKALTSKLAEPLSAARFYVQRVCDGEVRLLISP